MKKGISFSVDEDIMRGKQDSRYVIMNIGNVTVLATSISL